MAYFSFVGEAIGSADEVRSKLELHVSPVRWFRFSSPPTEFQGRVDRERFSIMRVVRGRDSFNPWICGSIRSGPSGTIVEARLTLHPAMWCFLALWSWFLAPSAWLTVKTMRHGANNMTEPISVFVLLFPWLMALAFFYFNAFRVKKLMFKLLELHDVVRLDG